MVAENFAFSLRATLIHEAGRVDDPEDPGGRTAYGITQRVYDGYRRNLGLATRDVWQITENERSAIYRNQYWNAIRGDRLPIGIDFVVFDGAVNSGPRQSVLWLQRALGTVKVDGVLGEATIAAVARHEDHDALIANIVAQRMRFLRALSTFGRFGKGWTRRVDAVEQAGQSQATGSVVMPVFAFISGGDQKAMETDVKKAPSQLAGTAIAVIGSSLPALRDSILSVRDELSTYGDTFPALQPVIANLGLIGSALAIVGIGYAAYGYIKGQLLNNAIGTTTADA